MGRGRDYKEGAAKGYDGSLYVWRSTHGGVWRQHLTCSLLGQSAPSIETS